ncbi:hypothetical protein LWI29_036440 [Acer saccharum]|uniref:O-methyltransferase C-terminal domain-containing protein n=1 Tax=Acer saccharum TaxID=4024 RepID=A0AA39VKN0_ACESA|nr:hypothetical protein LWI29_036440 [Acer saccharum]
MALLQDKVFLDSWSQLKDAVLEGGIPFDRVHGTHAFEYPGLDSRGFENVKHLVDVGGGLGVTLKAVTAKFPHIKGINFDLPHVIQHAPQYPGVEHVGGDMFESVPKGDAIFMKWILHDWSDEHCLRTRFLDSWSQLKDAVLEGGIPFNRVHGMHAFEYPGLDPRFNQVFNKAMNNTTKVIKNILEIYKGFENVKQLVDVGGGLGVTLEAIAAKYPNIKGINFDLPHVIQHAPHYPGVEHVGGDMFESVPKGDAIFMKWILMIGAMSIV